MVDFFSGRHIPAAPLLALACLLGGNAQARSLWDTIYPSISLTSDYRYTGVSYSDREPAAQGYVHWTPTDRVYGGLWISQVDFNDPGDTSVEVAAYAGYAFKFDSNELSLEALYTFYPDKTFRSPTYDVLQTSLRLRRAVNRATFGVRGVWTPEASYATGTAWRLEVEALYAIRAGLQATLNAGRRWIEIGTDRSYWDAGVTATWKKLVLDVRYVDTNLSFEDCRSSHSCDPAVVATVTLNFY